MATSSVSARDEALSRMLECPICLDKLEKPRMLKCFHFFCLACLQNCKEKQSIRCGVCRKITREKDIASVPIVNDFVEALQHSEKKPCIACKKEGSELRCLDCKALYCKSCRAIHDAIPACKHHSMEVVKNGQEKIWVDKLVYCEDHPEELCKLDCKDCETLLCVLCASVGHYEHDVETVEDSLHRLMTFTKVKLETLKEKRESLLQQIDHISHWKNCVRNKAEHHRADVKAQATAIINKIQLIRKASLKFIDDNLEKYDEEALQNEERRLNEAVCTVTRLVELGESLLTSVHGAPLLEELQSGLGKNAFDFEVDEKNAFKLEFSRTHDVKFVARDVSTFNWRCSFGSFAHLHPHAKPPATEQASNIEEPSSSQGARASFYNRLRPCSSSPSLVPARKRMREDDDDDE